MTTSTTLLYFFQSISNQTNHKMFDMEKAQKLMEITHTCVEQIRKEELLSDLFLKLRDFITPVYWVFHVNPSATVYEVVRAILANFFIIYVIFRGTLMSHKRIDIAMNMINYIFFSYIWPVFAVYFLFMVIIPSPTYQIW